jgi:hypothetical protein
VYIDNQTAPNQDYTQDADNYYVWYTTKFSTHQVSIVFASKLIPELSWLIILPLLLSVFSFAVILRIRETT